MERDGTGTRSTSGAVLVLLSLGLTVWRGPQYLATPNFWAEDGMLFFAGAWNSGPLHGLVQLPSGYLQLLPNLATSLAAWLVRSGALSLASAPRVTAVAGLLAQLVPIAVIAFAVAPTWGGVLRRAVAIAIVLVVPRTGNIWLNTVNSQFYLALAAIVILLEPPDLTPVRRWAYAALLVLCGLTGPVSALLTPLFVLKVWGARTRSAILLAAVSSLCAAVQVACVVASATGPARGTGLSVGAVGAVAWMRTVVLPVLGEHAAIAFGSRARPLVLGTPFAPPSAVFGMQLVATLGLLVVVLVLGIAREIRWWLAGSYLLVTVSSLVGAVGDVRAMLGSVDGSARYVFIPCVLVSWMLLFNIERLVSARGAAYALVLALAIGSDAWAWRSTLRWRADWPVWADQVAAWERNPRLPLAIWPRGWTMQLVPPEP